jgi:transcriptional regulator with XRE-family HTH domain
MHDEELMEQVALASLSIPNAWSRTAPGERLRAMRRAQGISRRHLAEKSGVDHSVIGDLERGADGRLSTWNRLFDVFGYRAVFLPLTVSEEGEEILQEEMRERKARMAEGLAARWWTGF